MSKLSVALVPVEPVEREVTITVSISFPESTLVAAYHGYLLATTVAEAFAAEIESGIMGSNTLYDEVEATLGISHC